jgi:hypothetical protein
MPAKKAAAHLYGLPREEFIEARKEAVKDLRGKGHADAADEVAALPKPTVAAWALNQAQRRDGQAMTDLIAAARRVREAQGELLSGAGRGGLDDAAAEERRLTEQVVDTARAELGSASDTTITKVRETLAGLGLDESLDTELGEGRLAKERETAGGFGFDPSAPEVKPAKGQAKRKAEDKAAKGRAEKAAKALAAAQDAFRDREIELKAAEQDLARARSAVERATAARDKAGRAVEKVREANA